MDSEFFEINKETNFKEIIKEFLLNKQTNDIDNLFKKIKKNVKIEMKKIIGIKFLLNEIKELEYEHNYFISDNFKNSSFLFFKVKVNENIISKSIEKKINESIIELFTDNWLNTMKNFIEGKIIKNENEFYKIIKDNKDKINKNLEDKNIKIILSDQKWFYPFANNTKIQVELADLFMIKKENDVSKIIFLHLKKINERESLASVEDQIRKSINLFENKIDNISKNQIIKYFKKINIEATEQKIQELVKKIKNKEIEIYYSIGLLREKNRKDVSLDNRIINWFSTLEENELKKINILDFKCLS